MTGTELEPRAQEAEVAASQEASTAADPGTEDRQSKPKINLDELPEGRALKSAYDKQIAALRHETEMERTKRLRAERAADEAKMEGMGQEEKLTFQLEKAYETIREMDRMRQEQLAEKQREADIDRLAYESGAPRDELQAAETYDEAVAIALRHAKTQAEKAITRELEEDEEKSLRNYVDVGSGKPPPPADDWETRRQELIAAGDSRGLVAHIMGLNTPGD